MSEAAKRELPQHPPENLARNAELLTAAGRANAALAEFLAEVVALRTRVMELERTVAELREAAAPGLRLRPR